MAYPRKGYAPLADWWAGFLAGNDPCFDRSTRTRSLVSRPSTSSESGWRQIVKNDRWATHFVWVLLNAGAVDFEPCRSGLAQDGLVADEGIWVFSLCAFLLQLSAVFASRALNTDHVCFLWCQEESVRLSKLLIAAGSSDCLRSSSVHVPRALTLPSPYTNT